ncbi:peptidyl-tRNA hydrolase 2, mitochondrial [Lucilia sericata]|uniref:peptidyl-tRNA hydrolase 2, mitochondrial n=1 Tax=Lucilia sericata TaxID=13632 RepID=UPI0018A86A65|nr:peptidyl-tRNA hydrolase 2, mitochondrial [Lucilia sericata]
MTKLLQSALKMVKSLPCPPTKLALIVRADLKMSKGKTAAQCAHAAVLCVQEAQSSNDKQAQQLLDSWLVKGQPKIVLKVDGGYDDLIQLQQKAAECGVVSALVQDAGRTQLAAGTATVLGIGPDTVERIDKLVGHLKLL